MAAIRPRLRHLLKLTSNKNILNCLRSLQSGSTTQSQKAAYFVLQKTTPHNQIDKDQNYGMNLKGLQWTRWRCRCFGVVAVPPDVPDSGPGSHSDSDTHAEKPKKLFTGINILKEGSDPEEKKDSEYPEWLWKLTEPLKPLEELTPSDKSYWRRQSTDKIRKQNLLLKQRRF